MASVMLEVLQEVTDPYGPALPLAEKIEGGHVPDNQLEAVPERWAARRSKIVRPAHQDGYHPYIPDPFRSAALAVVGTNLVLDFASREETEHDVRALGHHLLYADSVALSDPIPEIFDESYFTLGESTEAILNYRRTRLANLARFLTTIDSLVEDQTLAFVDAPKYEVAYTASDLQALGRNREVSDAVANLDPAGKELAARAGEAILNQPEGTMPFRPETDALFALNGILAELATSTVERGGWDLYLPQRAMQPVLAYLTEKEYPAAKTVSRTEQRHSRFLGDLLQVQLPNLTDQIKPGDLVAIRRDDAAFADWRKDLTAALRVLDEKLAEQPALTPADQLQTIQDDLKGQPLAPAQKSATLKR
jgi:hypothetical protein